MYLNNLPIGKRLNLLLGSIFVLCPASSLFAISRLRKMNVDVQLMVGEQLKSERPASDWYSKTYGAVQRAAAISKSSDPSPSEYFAPISAEAVR